MALNSVGALLYCALCLTFGLGVANPGLSLVSIEAHKAQHRDILPRLNRSSTCTVDIAFRAPNRAWDDPRCFRVAAVASFAYLDSATGFECLPHATSTIRAAIR